jgi:DNA-binding GntR family transcriptional regulator
MSVAAHRAKPLVCDHGRRRQSIVESLLKDVFQGKLRAGQHLVTQKLAARYGVSHTPVREALIALAGMGVIDLQPNRGAIVRNVTPREIREICDVRRTLECAAVRTACGRIDLADLNALARDLQRLKSVKSPDRPRFIEEAREIDSRLHDLIASSCGNAFLANEIGRLKTLFRAFRDVAWEHDGARNDYRRLAAESREHLAIVAALVRGDRREASLQLSRHIRAGGKYWSRALVDDDRGPAPAPSRAPSRSSSERRPR